MALSLLYFGLSSLSLFSHFVYGIGSPAGSVCINGRRWGTLPFGEKVKKGAIPLTPNKENQIWTDMANFRGAITNQLDSQIWVYTHPETTVRKHYFKNGKIGWTETTKPGEKEYYYKYKGKFGKDDPKTGKIVRAGITGWDRLIAGPGALCCDMRTEYASHFFYINKERTKRRDAATGWRDLTPKARERYCSCKRYSNTPCGTYPVCTAKVECPGGGFACSLSDCGNNAYKTSKPGFNIGNLIFGRLPDNSNNTGKVDLKTTGAVVQGALRIYVDSFDDFKVCDKQGQCYKVCYSDGTNCPSLKKK